MSALAGVVLAAICRFASMVHLVVSMSLAVLVVLAVLAAVHRSMLAVVPHAQAARSRFAVASVPAHRLAVLCVLAVPM